MGDIRGVQIDTGIGPNQIPIRDGSGDLDATTLAGNSIGTGANQIPQLDGSGNLPGAISVPGGSVTGTVASATTASNSSALQGRVIGIGAFNIVSTDGSSRLLLGNGSVSAPTYAFNSDGDTGMFFGGANTTSIAGNGFELLKIATSSIVTLTDIIPASDNTIDLGQGGFPVRGWRDIYANDGITLVSDVTKKTDIQGETLGLDFITSLNPVSFKWIERQGEKTDMDGNVLEAALPGVRRHHGMIAQEVKTTLDTLGVDSNDFAGWLLNEEGVNGTQFLRYSEFIAPLIKAIQELKTKNDDLEARIVALEA